MYLLLVMVVSFQQLKIVLAHSPINLTNQLNQPTQPKPTTEIRQPGSE